MLDKATKRELQSVTRRLSSVCANYVRHISKLSKVSPGYYKLKDGTSCYGFIPCEAYDEVLHTLLLLRKDIVAKVDANRPKFLDIGCGIGNVALLAEAAGYDAFGLEYDPDIYKAAKSMGTSCWITIMKGDMRKFRRYHEYDVLHFYQPMCSEEIMVKFTRKLAEDMKPGTYVMCNGTSDGFCESKNFKHVMNGVYKKEK